MATDAARRQRLDTLLVSRGLAPSREQSQALIAAGLVEVEGSLAWSASQQVTPAATLRVLGRQHPWSSRGGLKLDAALDAFEVDCRGRVALDAGASTGGFTDVLLSRGAALVYAVDVGRGLLDPRLAADPRVRVMDRTNLRHLRAVPGVPPDLVTLDLSFIGLRAVLPPVAALLTRPADVLALFKPQFELGRAAVGRGGIVKDPARTREGLAEFQRWCAEALAAELPHPPEPAAIRGTKGNQEWMVHLRLRGRAA